MELFAKEECNTGRQTFVDVAKVAAIVFMVGDHCMMYGGADLAHGLGWFFDNILGGALAALGAAASAVLRAGAGRAGTWIRRCSAMSESSGGISFLKFVTAVPRRSATPCCTRPPPPSSEPIARESRGGIVARSTECQPRVKSS